MIGDRSNSVRDGKSNCRFEYGNAIRQRPFARLLSHLAYDSMSYSSSPKAVRHQSVLLFERYLFFDPTLSRTSKRSRSSDLHDTRCVDEDVSGWYGLLGVGIEGYEDETNGGRFERQPVEG